MHRQYMKMMSVAVGICPVAASVIAARTVPAMIHGVRRPSLERVWSDRLPNTRLETRPTMAVTEFSVPTAASGFATPMSLNSWGSSTVATTYRPVLHSRPKARNPTVNRMLFVFAMLVDMIDDLLLVFGAASVGALTVSHRRNHGLFGWVGTTVAPLRYWPCERLIYSGLKINSSLRRVPRFRKIIRERAGDIRCCGGRRVAGAVWATASPVHCPAPMGNAEVAPDRRYTEAASRTVARA